jgi:hypothetical protein
MIDEGLFKINIYNSGDNRGSQILGQSGLWGGEVQGNEGFDESAGLDRTTRCTTND